ncbi:MAG: hypothetical protein ACI89L_000665 [Phycisphaerales bacterium]
MRSGEPSCRWKALVVGSFHDGIGLAPDAGSARVFELGCFPICTADMNGDIGAFITAFLAGC